MTVLFPLVVEFGVAQQGRFQELFLEYYLLVQYIYILSLRQELAYFPEWLLALWQCKLVPILNLGDKS